MEFGSIRLIDVRIKYCKYLTDKLELFLLIGYPFYIPNDQNSLFSYKKSYDLPRYTPVGWTNGQRNFDSRVPMTVPKTKEGHLKQRLLDSV